MTLAEVKDLLRRFTSERQSWAQERAAVEFGELVLCIMQQAERLGIDLVTAGAAHLQRTVANCRAGAPRAVPKVISLRAPGERPQ